MKTFSATITAVTTGLTMLVCGSAMANPVIDGARNSGEERAILTLLAEFGSWIDADNTYRPSGRALERIRFVEAGETISADGQELVVADRTRGLYDEKKATIYITRPWSPDDTYDRSVLLHELVHHIQVDAKHWYCPQSMEWDAYRLQETWLEEHDIPSGFYWPAILLESSCAKRDHHPD